MLNERKGVSDVVDNLSEKMGRCIINDAKQQKKKKSEVQQAYFTQNSFQINDNSFSHTIKTLTVEYVMYFTNSEELYNNLIARIESNTHSEADEETNTIRIISGFIGNEVASDFYETIEHELNHLLHYGMGFQKRQELYDKTKELIKLGRNNMDVYYVGLCSYYSFKHEQDAFAQQFYKFLMQHKYNGDIDALIRYSVYPTMRKCYDVLCKIQDKGSAMRAINSLGYSRSDFIRLVHYRLKCCYMKMRNVIMGYKEDNIQLNEHDIDRFIKRELNRLEESKNHGYDIQWENEMFYKF